MTRRKKAGELMDVIDRIQHEIRERYPAVKFIYVDPETLRQQKQQRPPDSLRKAG